MPKHRTGPAAPLPLQLDDFVQYLSEARVGSIPALGKLFQACEPSLRLLAGRVLGHRLRAKIDAEDLVQRTFVDAMRGFVRFQGATPAEFGSWLYRILRRRAAKMLRRYGRAQMRSIEREISLERGSLKPLAQRLADPAPTPDAAAVRREDAGQLRVAFMQLPVRCRHIVRLRDEIGLSFRAIGLRLHLSPEAARKRHDRAIGRLKCEMSKCADRE